MIETNERPILDRLATFFDDYDAFYNEPVPMLATQLCTDAHDEITSLRSQLEEARAAIRDYLDEFDAPVKDYALRAVLRTKLRALIAGSTK